MAEDRSKPESTTSPGSTGCVHKWKRLNDAESPEGGLVAMCEKCGATKNLKPPTTESGNDSRPLLLE